MDIFQGAGLAWFGLIFKSKMASSGKKSVLFVCLGE
jgi:hypothetical protein